MNSDALSCLIFHSTRTWEKSLDFQHDGMTVGASLVLNDEPVAARILNIDLIDVKRCEITVLALILCNIINSEAA